MVVLDNMHTGSTGNLEGLKGSLKMIKASCNDLPGMDLHPEKIYHLGIPSSSPMYKKNPYLVGEALNGFTAVFELAKKMRRQGGLCLIFFALQRPLAAPSRGHDHSGS